MKKIHYINIGNPKSGTSAIFNVLCQHPDVDYCKAKENYGYSQYHWTLEQYVNYYKDFNVSLNFCPSQWAMESKQIKELDSIFTHASIVFRNPVDFIESQLNFLPVDKHNNLEWFVNMLLETNLLEYTKIVKRWTSLSHRPFLTLLYDDLTSDPAMFYNKITNFIGLDTYNFNTVDRVNVTKNKKISIALTEKQIITINLLVEEFEDYSQHLLPHWKI
jgi:hypothetical protein